LEGNYQLIQKTLASCSFSRNPAFDQKEREKMGWYWGTFLETSNEGGTMDSDHEYQTSVNRKRG